jgi:hypothetical protein
LTLSKALLSNANCCFDPNEVHVRILFWVILSSLSLILSALSTSPFSILISFCHPRAIQDLDALQKAGFIVTCVMASNLAHGWSWVSTNSLIAASIKMRYTFDNSAGYQPTSQETCLARNSLAPNNGHLVSLENSTRSCSHCTFHCLSNSFMARKVLWNERN